LVDARFGGCRAWVKANAAVHPGNFGNHQFGEAIARKRISALPPSSLAGTE
jgi:hypothetical protein